MENLSKMLMELDRIFDIFNEKFYNMKLSKPIINIATNGKKHNTLGWFTTQKVWKSLNGNSYYEITICAEFLHRDITEICSTLLHEMVHLYCEENDIKDVSRSGIYHNKNFRKVAESHGLTIKYDEKIGHSLSSLNEDTRTFVSRVVRLSVFTLTRNELASENSNPPAGETKKSSTRKYYCPSCRTRIRATKEVNVVCYDCNTQFILNE